MTQFVPFTLKRWKDLKPQAWQVYDKPRASYVRAARTGAAWAMVDDDGHTLACGGLFSTMAGVGLAWSYIGADIGGALTPFVRKCRDVIDANAKRLPVVLSLTPADFVEGERMLSMLGFEFQGRMSIKCDDGVTREYERYRWTAPAIERGAA